MSLPWRDRRHARLVAFSCALGLAGLFSCDKGPGNPQEAATPGSEEIRLDATATSSYPLRDAAGKVDRYMTYYGA